jgi:transcriptional regulator with XRE-family HTH domain
MGNGIGEKICHYRQLKKLTQEELASRIGVTPQAVSKWERENGLPDVDVLAGIASVLEVSADVLNKQLVKIMVDNLKEQFPGVSDDIIPEKISYLQLERKLQEKLRNGESIKDMIHILEELEEQ